MNHPPAFKGIPRAITLITAIFMFAWAGPVFADDAIQIEIES